MDGTVSSSYPDEDVTVETTYNVDGAVATLVAKNPTTGDQTTKYVYGTTLSDSAIARADLLRAVIYPDSDDATTPLGDGADAIYDRVEYKYNRQGQRTDAKDQNGSVHQYDFDKRGRLLHDRVTTLATGVDGAVRRQSVSYDIRGLVEKQSTYDNATVGSGSVVNQVQFAYNSFAQATTEYQEHAGAVNTSTSVKVQQAFADGSAGHVRRTKTTYPNGRILRYEYNSGTDDAINRPSFLADDSSGSVGIHLAEYSYLGLGGIASEDFTQPQVKLDYDTAADGTFVGFDRFDRVLTHLWRDYGASADRDKFTYSYDRAGNRVYRENAVPSALDEYYTYDNVNRLTVSKRGDLNAGKTAISSTPTREENFTLDMTGNWPTYVQKTSGTTTLNQSRTHNPVNEITAAGSWATPAHDRAGNMTTVPKPSSLANGLTLKYDAWNRVVEVKDGATVVGKYEYDALGRRVKRHIDSESPSGPNGVDRYEHLFYDRMQVIETRATTNVNDAAQNIQPKYQYVWSRRYIDAPILRDENTDTDSLCDDARVYFLNDANMNVTSLVDTAGDALERYVYDPYGRVTIYNANWSGTRATSSYNNTILYTGRELDPESLFYFYRARYYSAELGRFVGRDPIRYRARDANLYRYVRNRPTIFVDAEGMAWCIPVAGAAGACVSASASQGIQGVTPLYPSNPGPNGKYRDKCGKCTISIELVCREMPADWTGMFYHCFLAVVDANGKYVEAVSGMRDDVVGSSTEGMTISAVAGGAPKWDLIAIETDKHITVPFGLPQGQDACQFLDCAQTYAAQISGNFKYNQYFDNSNTFITRVIRHCDGTADFPYWAFGSDDIDPIDVNRPQQPTPGTPCFRLGTPIQTEVGLRNIETVSIGEKIWSYDHERRVWVLVQVSHTEAHEYSGPVVAVSAGDDTIEATPSHPFWVAAGEFLETRPLAKARGGANQGVLGEGRWVAAQDIRVGDRLLGRGGQLVFVEEIETVEKTILVHNVLVERLNTYAVGGTGVLVNTM